MDFDKIREYGKNIKMSEEMKSKVLIECKANQAKEQVSNNSALWLPKLKRTVAVACALTVVIGFSLLYNQFINRPALLVDNADMFDTTSSSDFSTAQTKENLSQTQLNTQQEISVTEEQKTQKPSASETSLSDGTGGGVIGLKYYRHSYYIVPAPFVYLVGKTEYREWRETQPDPDETDVMLMVNFIRDFNISREDFDKANLESAWRIKYLLDGTPVMNPKDYANQEDDEVYNADIIYTFDNELINEYYLTPDYPYLFKDEYEDAVVNGTYETQTLDFIEVPVEQPMPESTDQELLKSLLSNESNDSSEQAETTTNITEG